MPAEARISSIWKKQKLFVAVFLIAFGGWFFWDGFIGYPRNNARYREWKRHQDEGRQTEWADFARQRGWKVDEWPKYVQEHHLEGRLPEEPFGRDKIIGQYVFGGIGVLIGGIVLIYWFTQKDRVIRTDEEAIYTPAGTRVPFGAVTGVGKKRWESKGIAVVRYEVDGRKGEFVVDDYKFDTDPSRQILKEIEENLISRTGPPPAGEAGAAQ